jgi:hypothetical protein
MSHQTISFIKSAVRIAGYALMYMIPGGFWPATVLIASEVIGIIEEIGH